MSRSINERFWSKVDVQGEDACWLWQASEGAHGYGQYRFKGTIDKAHRVAYELTNGTIPDGMWVLHRCDNRLCCNPNHLRLGSADDNVSEEIGKERASHVVRNRVESFTTSPTYDPEFLSYEHLMFTEKQDYDASALKYERRADLRLRNTNVVVLAGWGLKVCVRDGSLSVEYQRHDFTSKVLRLNRGVHKVRNIVVTSKGGFITLDAIRWLCEQNISMYLIDWKGEISQTLSPTQNRIARLAYLQYRAKETGLDVEIAKELIRTKARKQVEALKVLTDSDQVLEQFEDRAHQLDYCNDIRSVMMVEAGMAAAYWSCFNGHPIKWNYHSLKHIPEHWYTISTRASDISTYGNASSATNPFHATLNFGYALLECQVMEAINISGLSPEVGFLHTDEDGGNLLAYDLMECHRATVDALVLDLFQKTTFDKGSFLQWYTGEVRLNEELRRYILASCRVEDKAIDLQCRWLRALLED